MLRSSLCDYSNAYIFAKGNISINNTAAADVDANNANKKVIFKNFALFTDCIRKINDTQADNGKVIDKVMPMYNLIGYSDNYSKPCGSLWHYCKDIPTVNNDDNMVNFNGANATDSFNFKTKITGQTDHNGRIDDVKIIVSLKYTSNFRTFLETPIVNCKVNLIFTYSANCVLIYTDVANQIPTFTIMETNLYVPLVTLLT